MRLALATVLAAAVGFSFHVYYGEGLLQHYIQRAAQAGRLDTVISDPFPTWVVVLAFLTALLPYAVKVLVFHCAAHLLPARTALGRGLLYGLILLGLTDALARMPIMNFVTGNPLDVVILMSAEAWFIQIVSALVIAYVVPIREPPARSLTTVR